MIFIKIDTGNGVKTVFEEDSPLSVAEIWHQLEKRSKLSPDNFYIVHNGRLACEGDICSHGNAILVPRLLGGKGGFGSMLRAIGAQIEKTTNREACRDLSGRRLRDINEEKRLKAWIEKQAKREEEAAERKKKKLERLCAEPKHEFKDQNYEKERSILLDRVGDAVEEGFKAAVAGSSSLKRKQNEDSKPNKKKKTLLDLDIDSDELDTSDDDDEDGADCKKPAFASESASNADSGRSSDDTKEASEKSACSDGERSGSPCDVQITHATKTLESSKEDDASAAEPSADKSSENIEKT